MSISFADIVQAGVGVIALFILYSFIQNTSKDNERRDKSDQQFLLLFGSLTGKQDTTAASVIKSGVDSESRVTQQISTSEASIKARVQAVGDASLAAIENLSKLTDSDFKLLLANPQDPSALTKVQRAIELLTAKVQAVQDDLMGAKAEIASNTVIGAANTTAITHANDVLAAATPAVTPPPQPPVTPEVIVADISPTAIASIVDTIAKKTDAGDSELKEAI